MSESNNISEWQQMDDAEDFRNLLHSRVMLALGSKDVIYQAIVDRFEARVRNAAQGMVGGS